MSGNRSGLLRRLFGLGADGAEAESPRESAGPDQGTGVRPAQSERPVDYTVWVGLDFGTATTEAVVQIENRLDESSESLVIGWTGESRADSVVVLPSQVRRDQSGGFTGAAEIVSSGDPSGVTVEMKTRLLDAAAELAPAGMCDLSSCRASRDFQDALVHLSMCLASIRRSVRNCLGTATFKLHVQIAAPIEPAEESAGGPVSEDSRPVAAVFHELGLRALRGSVAVDGWRLDSAGFEAVLDAAFTGATPGLAESPVTLVPEALAAVVAHLEDPDISSHLFATVDVGGSTTDVAFVWYQSPDAHQEGEATCWYYSMRTFRVGTNDLVDAVFGKNGTDRAEAHAELARRRSLREGAAAGPCKAVADQIHAGYQAAWRDAFIRTAQEIRRWRERGGGRTAEWTLLRVGGGNDLDIVSETLEVPPFSQSYFDQHRELSTLGVPAQLAILSPDGTRYGRSAVQNRLRSDPVTRWSSMLTVAYGLSFRAPDLPRWVREEEAPWKIVVREREYSYVLEDT